MNPVIDFWFNELSPEDWFRSDPDLDQRISDRFGELWQRARHGELFTWRDSAEGRLAEILVLDQFSRNLARDTADAFAQDAMALTLAQWAIDIGADQQLPVSQRAFLYMPFMHSESALIHEQAVQLFSSAAELSHNLDFEHRHKAIIDRFGRYPHRNQILGRQSTPEELAFLEQPGSSF